MTPLLKKLNYKGHPRVAVLGAPDSFRPEMAALAEFAEVAEALDGDADVAF